METNDISTLNAVCINKLLSDVLKKIDNDLRRKIAINDKAVRLTAENLNKLIDRTYKLLGRQDYKRALIFICMLHRELA